ncbi:AEC family transporter [Pokkaliibacter plantistimulans]|uniref:AEC family transporter n=1 Tax=Proteobacteria bacterium 228 TaxID=2083153 RepID=A0A2S5KK54_9PROT|nr:AEC family transporter [Pokkaliibacter plantistimulans]
MTAVLDILSITLPIFLIITLGFIAVKRTIINADAINGMGRYVLTFALPALIFHALSGADLGAGDGLVFLLVYTGGSLLSFALGFALVRYVFGSDKLFSSVQAMGMAMSNSAFFGYPVLSFLLHQVPAQGFTMTLITENLIMFPLGLFCLEFFSQQQQGAERGRKALLRQLGAIFLRVVRSPIMLAIILGGLFSHFQWPVPKVIDDTMAILLKSSAAVALFAIGGSLGGMRVAEVHPNMLVVALCKLILHPLCILLMMLLLPAMALEMQVAAVVLAAMPMFSVYPIITGQFGHGKFTSGALVAAIVLSFFSITLWLWLIRLYVPQLAG